MLETDRFRSAFGMQLRVEVRTKLRALSRVDIYSTINYLRMGSDSRTGSDRGPDWQTGW